MNIFVVTDHRSPFFSHRSARIYLVVLALTTVISAQLFETTSRSLAVAYDRIGVNPRSNVWTPPNQRSSIMVTIDPRLPSGGSGSATVLFLNANGELLNAASASFGGLGKGVRGPRRDVRFGDTPFGVYKYVRPEGGAEDSQISPAFGTGKLYLDDNDVWRGGG